MIREEHREDLPEEELRSRRPEEERTETHPEEEHRGEPSGGEHRDEPSGGERRDGLSEEELRAAEEAARHSDDRDVDGKKVKSKKKTKWATFLMLLTVAGLLLSGHYLERTAPTEATYIPASESWEMVQTEQTQVDYELDAGVGGSIYSTAIIDSLKLYDYAINTKGMNVNSNSRFVGDWEYATKSEYQIMGISVVDASTNTILGSADLTRNEVSESVINANFGTFINNILQSKGKNRGQVRVRILLGNKGWIDADDFISHRCFDDAILERARFMEGTVYDFTGDYLTLSTGATINIKRPDGSFCTPGTIVKDSNGLEYRIISLNVTTSNEVRPQLVRHDEQYIPASEGGTKISYKLENINWGLAPLGLAAAGAAYLIQNRKKKDDDEEDEEESKRSGGRKPGSGKPKAGGSRTEGTEGRSSGDPMRTGTIRVRRPYTYSPGTDIPYSVRLDELHSMRIDEKGYDGMMGGLYGESREEGTVRTRH